MARTPTPKPTTVFADGREQNPDSIHYDPDNTRWSMPDDRKQRSYYAPHENRLKLPGSDNAPIEEVNELMLDVDSLISHYRDMLRDILLETTPVGMFTNSKMTAASCLIDYVEPNTLKILNEDGYINVEVYNNQMSPPCEGIVGVYAFVEGPYPLNWSPYRSEALNNYSHSIDLVHTPNMSSIEALVNHLIRMCNSLQYWRLANRYGLHYKASKHFKP